MIATMAFAVLHFGWNGLLISLMMGAGLAIVAQEVIEYLARPKARGWSLWKSEDNGLTWKLLETAAEREPLIRRWNEARQFAFAFNADLAIVRGYLPPGAI
ncbi:hypothetical protein KW786_01275 [Candidatus Parcubacteria bacterium]|nr:hypothetical protein [Candidatus Parcubacteria bacterium]